MVDLCTNDGICAVFVGIFLCLLCFGVMKLLKTGSISCPEGELFEVYIRYVKIRRAMAP